MKRRIAMGILAVLLLSACGNSIQSGNTMEQDQSNGTTETASITDSVERSDEKLETKHPVPEELETIPETYYSAIDDQGTLVELYYNTYESKTYKQKTQKLEKRAIVYLPYGYSQDQKYVEITNYMKEHAEAGDTIFYDIYTEEEKADDPDKEDTGLFFFKGNPGEKFAVCNAGGGFAYVGAMHDSFPHALELSKKGYNAFALIYRPGAQTACEDLARAISFIFEHAEELEVDTDCYSLWGGSAGARMAAWLGSYGPETFGGDDLPRPGAVIMQYTGHSEYTENDPPTYACVGERDGIASWRTMQNRINNLKVIGIDTQFHKYPGLSHGFGLGTGTVAEGWLDDAVTFWENRMRS